MHLIPAIEWDRTEISGLVTLGSDTIFNILNTDDVEIGMAVSDSVFPYGSRIVSKTINSVTLNKESIDADINYQGAFYKRFEFEYPPSTDEEEQGQIKKRVAESLSGERQTIIDFIEMKRELTFGFITPSDKKIIEDFYFNWAISGKKFRYYNDLNYDDFVIYENDDEEFTTRRQVKKAGSFLYEIVLKFRRLK